MSHCEPEPPVAAIAAGSGGTGPFGGLRLLERFRGYLAPGDAVLVAGCRALAVGDDGGWGEFDTVAIDESGELLTDVKSRHPRLAVRCTGAHRLAYPPASFDGVWWDGGSCCWPADGLRALSDAFRRVLRPSGVLGVVADVCPGGFDGPDGNLVDRVLCSLGPGFVLCAFRSSTTSLALIVRLASNEKCEALDKPDCPFCSGDRFQLNRNAALPGAGSIVWGDDEVYVSSDIAPIVEGHVLITTVRHYLSAADAPVGTRRAIRRAQSRITRLFREVYRVPALFFEHGARVARAAGSCIDHAHVHAVPLTVPLVEWVQARVGTGRPGTYDDAARDEPATSYLYVEEETRAITIPVSVVPSQVLRAGLAGLLHLGEWRWQHMHRQDRNRRLFADTVAKLGNAFDARASIDDCFQ